MKRILFLLFAFAFGFIHAQDVTPLIDPINPTFSTVTTPTIYGSSSASGTLNIMSNSTATAGIINIGGGTGTVNINNQTNITNTLTVGSAVAQSSLANFYVNNGTSTLAIGEISSGLFSAWVNRSTPTSTNYFIANDNTGLSINDALGGNVMNLRLANNIRFQLGNAASYLTTNLRVGSSTAPSATLDVTGTMNVSGTATVANITSGGYDISGLTAMNSNSNRVRLASSGSFTACEISGTKPLILNSAVLTGGNTGTVAVLSDAVFNLNFNHISTNPADATTYYFGNMPVGLSTSTVGAVRIPYNCTLVGYDYSYVGSASSSETATLAIAGTTNYTLSTSISYTAVATFSNTNVTGLSQNFNAGDIIDAKLICPTWATNPTSLVSGLTLWFVRRQ